VFCSATTVTKFQWELSHPCILFNATIPFGMVALITNGNGGIKYTGVRKFPLCVFNATIPLGIL